MEFTPENVESVLTRFYCEGFDDNANKWLIQAQNSPNAWQFSWAFLDPSKSASVQFFGASTLYLMITNRLHELNTVQCMELKDALIKQILQLSSTYCSQAVTSKLSLCLAQIAFRTTPDIWERPISSLVNQFNSVCGPEKCPPESSVSFAKSMVRKLLLALIKDIAEEFLSAYLNFHRRNQAKEEFQKDVPLVLQLVEEVLCNNEESTEVYEQCIKTCSTWMSFSVSFIERRHLIEAMFKALHSPQLCNTAVECLINVFQHPQISKYPQLVRSFFHDIISLHPLIFKSLRDPEEHEYASQLANLITSIAESHCALILEVCLEEIDQGAVKPLKDLQTSGAGTVRGIIDILLEMTGAPGYFPTDEDISDCVFNFWYTLQDEIISSEPSKSSALNKIFSQTFLNLFSILFIKVQYPDWEVYQPWNCEDKERFRCYRQDIADTVTCIYYVVRNALLDHIYCALRDCVENNPKWQEVEALLYLLSNISEDVAEHLLDHPVSTEAGQVDPLAQVFSLFPGLPLNNLTTIDTMLRLLASYQNWMSDHPEYLGESMKPVLECIHQPQLIGAAGFALKTICQENHQHLKPYVSDILDAIKRLLSSHDSVPIGCERILFCLGYVVILLPDEHTAQLVIDTILKPQLDTFNSFVYSNSISNKEKVSNMLQSLAFFSPIFHGLYLAGKASRTEQLEQTQLTQNAHWFSSRLMHYLLPGLEHTLPVWTTSDALLRELGLIFSWCFSRIVLEQASVEDFTSIRLFISLIEKIPSPHTQLLDLGCQVAIGLKHTTGEMKKMANNLVEMIVKRTEGYLLSKPCSSNQQEHLRGNTELIEHYLMFLRELISNAPFYLQQIDLSCAFQLAVYGVSLPEALTVRSSTSFLATCLSCSHGEIGALVSHLVKCFGFELNQRMLIGIVGGNTRSAVEHYNEVFAALSKHSAAQQTQWLKAILFADDDNSEDSDVNSRTLLTNLYQVNKPNRLAFFNSVSKPHNSKLHIKSSIRDLAEVSRGIFGEYARSTAPNNL